MRLLRGCALLICVSSAAARLGGCTTIQGRHPETGVALFHYSSTKDVNATGLLIEVEYNPDGSKKSLHIEAGKLVTETEIELMIETAIKAALIAAGVPIP
jgi:hypothetical protein